MKKNAKQLILRIVLAVIISLVLGSTVYTVNARRLTGDLMPMPFGIGIGDVLSGSMEPELSVADLIIVKKTGDYTVGDTVVFQTGSTLVVHKIISIDGEDVITMGTANNTPDDPIKYDNIKGEVIFVIPSMGRVFDVVRSPIVSALILAVAVFLMVKSYQKEKEHEDDDIVALMEEIKKLRLAQMESQTAANAVLPEEKAAGSFDTAIPPKTPSENDQATHDSSISVAPAVDAPIDPSTDSE